MVALADRGTEQDRVSSTPPRCWTRRFCGWRRPIPAYFGTYDRFAEIREHVDRYGNLFLIGRNGMHRYNNQDHSMLTAMIAVENIIAGSTDKNNLWEVNTEMDYLEEKGNSK